MYEAVINTFQVKRSDLFISVTRNDKLDFPYQVWLEGDEDLSFLAEFGDRESAETFAKVRADWYGNLPD